MALLSRYAAVLLIMASSAGVAHAGCVTGAVVGGVAGHVAGRHTLVGAAAGCYIGHEMAVKKKRKRAAERAAREREWQVQGRSHTPR